MARPRASKRIFIDLNHPADFHLFKSLIAMLEAGGYELRISARKKDCLQNLLEAEGIQYLGRGRGSNRLGGKYLFGLYLLGLTSLRLMRFRPHITLSLSSPYLILVSRLLGIPTICYDDNDLNPRLQAFLKRASVLISPRNYRYKLNQRHLRLPVMKELAYIRELASPHKRQGIFFRITRTDTVHHSIESVLDQNILVPQIRSWAEREKVILASEEGSLSSEPAEVRQAHLIHFHEDLNSCQAFWGNSATMAAEAALLGLPAIFVSAELTSCLKELVEAGLLHHFLPADLEASFLKLEACLLEQNKETAARRAKKTEAFIAGKRDLNQLLFKLVEDYPNLPEE